MNELYTNVRLNMFLMECGVPYDEILNALSEIEKEYAGRDIEDIIKGVSETYGVKELTTEAAIYNKDNSVWVNMVAHRCGIYSQEDINTLLANLPSKFTLADALNVSLKLFPNTLRATISKAKKPVWYNDAGFDAHLRAQGLTSKSSKVLFAKLIVAYGDGCSYEDYIVDMDEEDAKAILATSPHVYHYVKNLLAYTASNATCVEFVRILMSWLPIGERNIENLARIVRYGIS